MDWLLKLLGIDPLGKIIGAIGDAYKAKLTAKNDEDRIAADVTIKNLESILESKKIDADVVKTGMQYKVFWIPWLMAAVPTAAWYGWGMCDSLMNGSLPDVATLPPQLKEYADVVFVNIFYSGAGMGGVQVIAGAIRSRK